MKRTFVLITLGASVLTSCKDEVSPKPTSVMEAQLGWEGPLNTDESLVMATNDLTILANKSLNASSIEWDLGNGIKSNAETVNLTYPEKGDYTVTLTATGKDGSTSIATKKILVKERVINSFSIDNFSFKRFSDFNAGLPLPPKLDLWIELKFSADVWPPYTADRDVIIDAFYTSPVFAQIDSSFHASLKYTVTPSEKITIGKFLSSGDFLSNHGNPPGPGLIANLYGKDDKGTYLLFSSMWSGWYIKNLANPAFSDNYGLQSQWLNFNCQFE